MLHVDIGYAIENCSRCRPCGAAARHMNAIYFRPREHRPRRVGVVGFHTKTPTKLHYRTWYQAEKFILPGPKPRFNAENSQRIATSVQYPKRQILPLANAVWVSLLLRRLRDGVSFRRIRAVDGRIFNPSVASLFPLLVNGSVYRWGC